MCKESDVLVASTACAVGTTIASNASSRKERSNRVLLHSTKQIVTVGRPVLSSAR